MKILKIVLIVLATLIAVPLVVAAIAKKDYSVERSVTINKPRAQVFAFVKLLKNQDQFSKWASMDPAMKKTYTGTDGTIGFISAWDSQDPNVGVGEQEIKGITEGERLDFELRFKKPFEATDKAYMITESAGEKATLVKWGFNGHMKYPMNLMLLFMDFDKMLGSDLQTGLDNLKRVLEK